MDQPHTLALVENKYGFVIVDDFTRYTWVFFLVDKSDVFATFKSFVNGIHNEFETTIKKVRSDNGSEFTLHHNTNIASHVCRYKFTNTGEPLVGIVGSQMKCR